MSSLSNRRLLLIISGGIAAYKSLDLIRRLRDEGAAVRCILTSGGAQFITPLSVSALSGEPVFMNMFSPEEEQRLGHIRLSREADLIVIAPASADMIAKMAHGLADTLASAVLLAAPDKPVLIAPAMNSRMWAHPATRANIAALAAREIKQIGPNAGALACGEEGAGRMSEVPEILDAIKAHFANGPLAGKKALVTSGPTYEPLDPVRFIGNRSSGKQGHAIAEALAASGADVTLVSGPTALPDPPGLRTIRIGTAREMLEACQANGPYDMAVCAAAVADWRPAEESGQKIKKTPGASAPAVTLTENPDILATLAKSGAARPRLVIGFAAETGDLEKHATEKFTRKGCDWLLANDVGGGKIFGGDENEIVFFAKDGNGEIMCENWDRASKDDVARRLAEKIAAYFQKQT